MSNPGKFFDQMTALDQLMQRPPTDQNVQEFAAMVKSSEQLGSYAFSTLSRADWIPALRRAQLMELASAPSRISSAQSTYLKRMASDDSVQRQVLEIMLGVRQEIDQDMIADFTDAALAMRDDLASLWGRRVIEWFRAGNQVRGGIADSIGKLIAKLAKAGDSAVAVSLASELLAVLPDPDADKKRQMGGDLEKAALATIEPSIRCDRYDYEQVLQDNMPDLVDADPFGALDLLCSLLGMAIALSRSEGEQTKPRDATYLWRSAIEDHEQNHDYGIDCPLITAVRDAAERICRNAPGKVGEVVEHVERHGWYVFKRIGLHLLRVVEKPPAAIVEEHLVNEELFNLSAVHHEYYHLLRVRYAELSATGQEMILKWIEQAAPEQQYLVEHDGDLSAEKKEKRLTYWRLKKLSAIEQYLTGEWRQRFEAWNHELEPMAMPPDFHSYTTSWTGRPESPIKKEELGGMTPAEVVVYLKTWKPSGELRAPTPGGLGASLGDLVAEQPELYAAGIAQFMDAELDPTYIRHVISGFCRALESGKSLPYGALFGLCRWVLEQPRDLDGRAVPEHLRDGFDIDRTWRNTRSEIVRLVEKAFGEKSNLPFSLRPQAWAVLEPLTDDPEPDDDYERNNCGDNMDPLTLSLNTVRGKALHTVMNYAMWVYRHIKADVRVHEKRTPEFKDMPEVLAVLERHLDVALDRSQTCRAVYGQWLPQIVHLGSAWVEWNKTRLFPDDPGLAALRNALWRTYLLYGGQVHASVAKVLTEIYREEVLKLRGKDLGDKQSRTPEAHLVEHIVILHLWDDAHTLDEGGLVDLLFKNAPVQLTAHAMSFMARAACRQPPLEAKVRERMKALWEWRVRQVGGPDKMPKEELSGFGWWFACGAFDAGWAFGYLEAALKQTDIGHSRLQVFERLNEAFATHPQESLRCLRLFIDRNEDPWFCRGGRQQKGVWALLEQAIASSDSAIRDPAEDIVHLLGSKGYLEYRELLKTGPEGQS